MQIPIKPPAPNWTPPVQAIVCGCSSVRGGSKLCACLGLALAGAACRQKPAAAFLVLLCTGAVRDSPPDQPSNCSQLHFGARRISRWIQTDSTVTRPYIALEFLDFDFDLVALDPDFAADFIDSGRALLRACRQVFEPHHKIRDPRPAAVTRPHRPSALKIFFEILRCRQSIVEAPTRLRGGGSGGGR